MIERRRLLLVVVAALIAALGAGCGNDSPGMMDRRAGNAASQSPGFGGPMMGSVPRGYHMSRLSCSAPALPGRTVQVIVADMGMTTMMGGTAPLGGHMMLRASSTTVPSGQVSFAVANMGWRTHEMVVLPLAPGQAEGQRTPGRDGRVDETGSLGEASASCASGSGEGITSGSVGWVTLTLAPGKYELVCNLPNHYANGMRQAFVVTSH